MRWPFRRRRADEADRSERSTGAIFRFGYWFGGALQPDRHGSHASPSILAALHGAESARLHRVRLDGGCTESGDPIAPAEWAGLASADALEPLLELAREWTRRALVEAQQDDSILDAAAHRAFADAARDRVIAMEQRVRDAQWVLEEGAGRRVGEARERAIGERAGAERAVIEARAAAYAHEAAAALAESSSVGPVLAPIRGVARAVELVVDALALFDPDPIEGHERVRSVLEREAESRLDALFGAQRADRAPSEPSYDVVEPASDVPHAGEELVRALDRALAPHPGVRGVHPLVIESAMMQDAMERIGIVLRCDSLDIAQRAVDAIDADPQLARVHPVGVWGNDPSRFVPATRERDRAALRHDHERTSWRIAIEDALSLPTLARDRDALWRAWLAQEPGVERAAWSPEGVLLLVVDDVAAARAVVARVAAHHPSVCARTELGPSALSVRTSSVDPMRDSDVLASLATPFYRRGLGLVDPALHTAVPEGASVIVAAPSGPDRRSQTHELTWMQTLVSVCSPCGGFDGWAIGGDAKIAEAARHARTWPVVVWVRERREIAPLIRACNASDELERLGIGVLVLHTFDVEARSDWAADRRMRAAFGGRTSAMFPDPSAKWPRPSLFAQRNELETCEMHLRWHLVQRTDVVSAAWAPVGAGWAPASDQGVRLLTVSVAAGASPDALGAALASIHSGPIVVARPVLGGAEIVWRNEDPRALLIRSDDLERAVRAALARPDVYHRDSLLASPLNRAGEQWVPGSALSANAGTPRSSTRPNARCPRCGLEVRLPAGTPLAATLCAYCDNPCLVAVADAPRAVVVVPSESELRCSACEATFHVAITGAATHVRCPECRRAVPIAPGHQ